jgi:predicted DNA-binding helix-hairpin-helix protein
MDIQVNLRGLADAKVVRVTLDFYRRNHIEGLFPSSGAIRPPDCTM